MDEQLELLKKFPLLIPINKNFSEYDGFLKIGDSDLYFHVKLPNYPSLAGMTYECSWELEIIMRDFKNDIEQWISSSSTILKFLEWLQNLVLTILRQKQAETKVLCAPTSVWKKLFKELQLIGLDKVSALDPQNLAWVDLMAKDIKDRAFCMRVQTLSGTFNQQLTADLPEATLGVIKNGNSMLEAYNIFSDQVLKLQPFWDAMDELDSQCWILDPPQPSPSDTRRQIAIDSELSVLINVDPFLPFDQPEISFLGPNAKVEPLHRILSTLKWPQQEGTLVSKLEESLGVHFSGKPESQALSQLSQGEMCVVCLLAGKLDQTCEDCGSVFHQPCLREWLQTVPDSSSSFNRIVGKCPTCKQPISCLL